jgi:tetratricopeptide (TPR) repeat protein
MLPAAECSMPVPPDGKIPIFAAHEYHDLMRISIILTLLFAFALTACQEGLKNGADSHARMVFLLDSLARNADPISNFQLNAQRAENWKKQTETLTDEKNLTLARFNMANELLNAGQAEDAIQEFTALIKQVQDKVFYDQLAISYLKLGVQQNSAMNPASASHILPIAEQGWHRATIGAESAIKVYEKILQTYPDDVQARYLMNLAYMMLGKYPEGVPEKFRMPASVFQSPNPDFPRFPEIAAAAGLDVSGLSGGVSMEDFNNDGYLDLFLTSSGPFDQAKLYFANGDGTYRDVTEAANLTGITGGANTVHADYNNDGFIDILILRGGWLDLGGNIPNSLLRNNGDGTFADVTIEAGLLSFFPTQAAAWGDFNQDGWLDLFIGNEAKTNNPVPSELYLNKGDGTFVNIAPQVKLDFQAFVKGCAWGDFNNDNLPDLFVSVMAGPNMLFMNEGGQDPLNWKFRSVGTSQGLSYPIMANSCILFDYNNDNNLDIFISVYDPKNLDDAAKYVASEMLGSPQEDVITARLYRNDGNLTFTDVTKEAGLSKALFGMGINFGDLDNDGWLDFYVGTGTPDNRAIIPNRMFRNVEGQRFEEITMNGFGHIQKGQAIAFGDLDCDGDQDIYCVVGGAYQGDAGRNILFENPGSSNGWLTIRLEGQRSNRSAIGARILVEVQNQTGQKRRIFRTIGTGGSFGAGSLREEIGLGDAKAITAVEITWPKGNRELFLDVPMNKHIRIVEGAKTFKEESLPPVPFKKRF